MSGKDADNDIDLLKQVAEGNEVAFRQLFHAYADLLHTFIYKLTRSKEVAEEVVQEIFLQIWTARETLAGVRNFRNYLFVIARNHAFKSVQKIMKERIQLQQLEKTLSPDEQSENKESILSLIDEAITYLPPQQQRVWILSRREGLKYVEIAAQMGLSRETVKKYLQYATAAIVTYVQARIDILLIGLLLTML